MTQEPLYDAPTPEELEFAKRPPLARRTQLDHLPSLSQVRTDAGNAAEVTLQQYQALVAWSEEYGLDVEAGQACFMYGLPYVTERGAVANAARDPDYDGYEVRRLSDAEKEDLGFQAADIIWECAVAHKDRALPTTELGVVQADERQQQLDKIVRNLERDPKTRNWSRDQVERVASERAAYTPLFGRPTLMARARAIRRAHLLAFPLRRRDGGAP